MDERIGVQFADHFLASHCFRFDCDGLSHSRSVFSAATSPPAAFIFAICQFALRHENGCNAAGRIGRR